MRGRGTYPHEDVGRLARTLPRWNVPRQPYRAGCKLLKFNATERTYTTAGPWALVIRAFVVEVVENYSLLKIIRKLNSRDPTGRVEGRTRNDRTAVELFTINRSLRLTLLRRATPVRTSGSWTLSSQDCTRHAAWIKGSEATVEGPPAHHHHHDYNKNNKDNNSNNNRIRYGTK